ncbi:MAG: replicative DNA helicase [Prevotella sp.]|nr:replicative DNA helicase [Prevotella sp.]
MPQNTNNSKNRKSSAPIDDTYGHLQPQAIDIERVVLGALMIDKDAFSLVSDILKPESFYDPRHQKIYAAVLSLSMNDKPVDLLTVTEELKRQGEIDDVGGVVYIMELTQQVVSSAHIEYHAHILAQKSLMRQLISYTSRIQELAFDDTADPEAVMQTAEGSLFEISQKNLKSDYTQIDPVLKEAVQIMQKASQNTSGVTGVPTGYGKLDDMTAGWQPSDLVIIAGRPAMGKTAFALSLAKNIVVDYQQPVAFFSLEMSNVQLVNRLMANVCEISGKNIQNGQLTDDEWKRLDSNLRKLEGKPLYIDDTPGLSIFELRTKARRLVREKGIKLIMIDYLQLMNANGMRFGNRQEEVSTISRSLKGLAKELNIPILALSQLNRGVESREGNEGKRPQLSDLRESGAIEQDADMVLFVHRPEYYGMTDDGKGNDLRGKAYIIIAKHRKGGTGDVVLRFKGEYTRFEDESDTYLPPVSESGAQVFNSRMNRDDEDDPLGPPLPEGEL